MKKKDYTFEQISSKVDKALDLLYEKDLDLIKRDVNERTITQHLALYLGQCFSEWEFHIDCEYNRNYTEPKYLNLSIADINILEGGLDSKDTDARTVYPDIIMHKRDSNDENLLVIEAKKENPSNILESLDIKKLKAFTSKRNEYKYLWGLYVVFTKKRPILKWFESGDEKENF